MLIANYQLSIVNGVRGDFCYWFLFWLWSGLSLSEVVDMGRWGVAQPQRQAVDCAGARGGRYGRMGCGAKRPFNWGFVGDLAQVADG